MAVSECEKLDEKRRADKAETELAAVVAERDSILSDVEQMEPSAEAESLYKTLIALTDERNEARKWARAWKALAHLLFDLINDIPHRDPTRRLLRYENEYRHAMEMCKEMCKEKRAEEKKASEK